MPRKLIMLKAMLLKAGFEKRAGKGSHTISRHRDLPKTFLVLSGNDGDKG